VLGNGVLTRVGYSAPTIVKHKFMVYCFGLAVLVRCGKVRSVPVRYVMVGLGSYGVFR
jgi:hypothetical protein